jgi:hypothetical protein
MLKADIDSGQTGDKVGVFDPGLSPLGTVALARRYENAERWFRGSRRTGYVHQPPDGTLTGFVGFIAATAIVMIAGISAF